MKRKHSALLAASSTAFVTTTVVKFLPIFGNEALAQIVLDNMKIYVQKCRVHIHAFVLMPSHLHLLLTGEYQDSFSKFMGRMKEYSAKEIISWCLQNNENKLLTAFATAASESKQGHKYQVWQKRFDSVVITRREDMFTKLNYIHNNPLQERWGLCDKIEDYRFSSARYYIAGEDTEVPIVTLE